MKTHAPRLFLVLFSWSSNKSDATDCQTNQSQTRARSFLSLSLFFGAFQTLKIKKHLIHLLRREISFPGKVHKSAATSQPRTEKLSVFIILWAQLIRSTPESIYYEKSHFFKRAI